MDIHKLTVREKAVQTVVLRHKNDQVISEKIGAVFFGGEIITEAEDMGLDQARSIIPQYFAQTGIPPLVTSDFENGCGSIVKQPAEIAIT